VIILAQIICHIDTDSDKVLS